MRKTLNALAAVVACFAVLGVAAPSSAATYNGFACEVSYKTTRNASGTIIGQYLTLSVYAGAGCSGNYLYSARICNTGTGMSYCSATRLPDPALLSVFESLQRAASEGQPIVVTTDGNNYWSGLTFRAN